MAHTWTVDGVCAVDPTAGSGCDASYLLKLSSGDERAQAMVEFAAPAAVASGGYAEEVLSRFLDDDEPPQRLVVEQGGEVRVATAGKPREAGSVPRRP
ncbi:MAG: hypothetical protein ACRDM1_10220, partial [Gaiellaceae bacterium]